MSDSISNEEEYAFNEHCMLAGVFSEMLSVRERTIVQAWILKLKAIRDPSQFRLKLEYVNYLMYCIVKNCMVYPFNRVPFDRPLQPLEDVVPKEQFVRDKSIEPSENDDLPRVQEADLQTPEVPAPRPLWPGEFIKRNPIPKSGVMCYMAAFGE